MTANAYTPEQLAESIKREILASTNTSLVSNHVRQGLRRAKSFSELHDYCDANMLGDTAEVYEQLTKDIPNDETRAGKLDGAISVINAAQDIVDKWLKNGRPAAESPSERTWVNQFEDWQVPKNIADLVATGKLVDESCGNDIMPKFLIVGSSPALYLWVNHPDTKMRKGDENQPRFVVVYDGEGAPTGESEFLLQTNSLQTVLEFIENAEPQSDSYPPVDLPLSVMHVDQLPHDWWLIDGHGNTIANFRQRGIADWIVSQANKHSLEAQGVYSECPYCHGPIKTVSESPEHPNSIAPVNPDHSCEFCKATQWLAELNE